MVTSRCLVFWDQRTPLRGFKGKGGKEKGGISVHVFVSYSLLVPFLFYGMILLGKDILVHISTILCEYVHCTHNQTKSFILYSSSGARGRSTTASLPSATWTAWRRSTACACLTCCPATRYGETYLLPLACSICIHSFSKIPFGFLCMINVFVVPTLPFALSVFGVCMWGDIGTTGEDEVAVLRFLGSTCKPTLRRALLAIRTCNLANGWSCSASRKKSLWRSRRSMALKSSA